MADRPSINEEAGLPSNFIPIDVPAITGRPSPPSVGDITPIIPQYFQGSLNPDLQHDADFVNTALRSSSAPKFALMPPGIQSSPLTSTQLTSAIKTNAPATVPTTGGGSSEITLDIPAEFTPTTQTVTLPGPLAFDWATQPAGYELQVPNGSVGFDGAVPTSGLSAGPLAITSGLPSTNPEWAFYIAILQSATFTTTTLPGWTALAGNDTSDAFFIRNIPTNSTVSVSQGFSTTGSFAGAILNFSGSAPAIIQSRVAPDVGTGSITATFLSNTTAGSFIIAVYTCVSPSHSPSPGIFSDTQVLKITPLSYTSNNGSGGIFGCASQVVLLSTASASAEAVTVTYPTVNGGQLTIYEIAGLSAIAVKPRFSPEPPTDLSTVTGRLPLFNGGTGANLSSTGGPSRVVRQSTIGGAFTVSQLAASDLSNGTTGTGAVVLAASPTMTGVVTGGTFDSNTSPAGLAGAAVDGYDSTTKTPVYNSNNNGVSAFTGAWNNVNVTPVTVSANTTSDQNLMSVSIPAGTLNRVGRSFKIHCAGVYTTPLGSTATVEIKIKLGSLTLLDMVSTNPGQVTNNKWLFDGWITTQTAGASAAFEASGAMIIDLGSLTTSPDTIFADTNAATIGTLDSTAAQTLQVTVAFNSASASNSTTQRQMIIETVN